MILGSHLSTSGGVKNSILIAQKIGCKAIQIFTKNQRRWESPPLKSDDIKEFLKLKKKYEIKIVFSHASYLINLATDDENLRKKSIESLIDEINRADQLKLPFVVIHIGSHKGIGEERGIKNVVLSLNEVVKIRKRSKVKILLETTAGQGTNLGYKFEHIGDILKEVEIKERFGCCLDTCHIFAAGYDFSTKEKYEKMMNEFDKKIGIKNLFAIHLNDSLKELGSRKDRHAHIGKGFIGPKPFSFFLNDVRLKDIPGILETPKDKDYLLDVENLKILKSLIKTNPS